MGGVCAVVEVPPHVASCTPSSVQHLSPRAGAGADQLSPGVQEWYQHTGGTGSTGFQEESSSAPPPGERLPHLSGTGPPPPPHCPDLLRDLHPTLCTASGSMLSQHAAAGPSAQPRHSLEVTASADRPDDPGDTSAVLMIADLCQCWETQYWALYHVRWGWTTNIRV